MIHHIYNRTVCVSGGFDPLHIGHIDLLRGARRYGTLIVILNSDEWLIRKKNKVFMPFKERKVILETLSCVERVVPAEDEDGTVCESLRKLKPMYFVNSGDRDVENTPEFTTCLDFNIKPVFLDQPKVQSSSELLEKWTSMG